MSNFLGNPNMVVMRQDELPVANYEYPQNPTIDVNPPRIPMSWLNTETNELFICTDNTVGLNVWQGQLGTVINQFSSMPELIHHYPLISDAKDVVGSDDGVVYGLAINSGVICDGVDGNRVTLSSNAFGLTDSWSFCLWGSTSRTDTASCLFHITNSSYANLMAVFPQTDNTVDIVDVSGNQEVDSYVGGELFFTYIDSSGVTYINGNKHSVRSVDLTGATELNICTDVDGSPTYNNCPIGIVKDVMVMSQPLTDEEILGIYNLGV